MIREIDTADFGFREKVLVCITAQSNSRRLIDAGAEVASKCSGELHILHVQKGENVFNNSETLHLLQQLFLYGSEKGGMIHAFCEEDIAGSIAHFVKEEKITRLVLGELPEAMRKQLEKSHRENQFQKILDSLPKGVRAVIIKRAEEKTAGEETKRKIV